MISITIPCHGISLAMRTCPQHLHPYTVTHLHLPSGHASSARPSLYWSILKHRPRSIARVLLHRHIAATSGLTSTPFPVDLVQPTTVLPVAHLAIPTCRSPQSRPRPHETLTIRAPTFTLAAPTHHLNTHTQRPDPHTYRLATKPRPPSPQPHHRATSSPRPSHPNPPSPTSNSLPPPQPQPPSSAPPLPPLHHLPSTPPHAPPPTPPSTPTPPSSRCAPKPTPTPPRGGHLLHPAIRRQNHGAEDPQPHQHRRGIPGRL